MNDTPIILMLLIDTRTELGYVAIGAKDGPAGLEILQSDARIDLLISDMGSFNSMSLNTAMALSLTAPCVEPETGWASVIAWPSSGGNAARRQLRFIGLPIATVCLLCARR